MSVAFVVIPAVAEVGWPILRPVMIAAGAAMGYRATKTALDTGNEKAQAGASTLDSVSMNVAEVGSLGSGMMRGENFTLVKDDITAVFHRDGRGDIAVHLSGDGIGQERLREAGAELINRVKQQYAYTKVMSELEERGFEVVNQEAEADHSIRIQVRRWN